MDITLPNGAVIRGVPEGVTKDQVRAKAIAAGLATEADFGRSAPAPQQAAQPKPSAGAAPSAKTPENSDVGIVDALGSGFKRGVEQTFGGIGQRVGEFAVSQNNSAIDEFARKIQDGEIPATQENLDRLDKMQSNSVRLAGQLSNVQNIESRKREEYAPTQESRPIASFVGNVGGQMAALPIPGVQGRLPVQMAHGALSGGLSGYTQATTKEESASDNAGMGSLLGGAAPAVLRPITNVLGGAYRAIVGRPSQEVAQVAQYADEQNLPLMTSDVVEPQTFAGRAARSLGEKIPVAGTGAMRADQQAARVDQVRQIAEQYGAPNDAEIVASLTRKSDRLSQAAGNRYQRIIQSMGDTAIPLENTTRVIDQQLARYGQPGAAQNPAITNALQEFRDQITSGDNNLELLRQNRTLFRELIRGENGVMTDSGQQAANAVYRAITQDMTNGVTNTLGPESANALRQVDGIWAREAQELKNTKLKNIFSKGEIKPEEATKMLFSNDRSEARTLYDALDTAGRQNARAAIINRAVEKSADSPDRFVNEMRKLRNQSDIFFRGRDGRQLDGLINYLDYTREASRASVSTKSGQELMQVGVPAGIFADLAATGGAGTAGFATIGGLSRLYESRPVRNLMIRMASVPRGSTEFETLASAFEREVQKAAAKAPNADKEEEQ